MGDPKPPTATCVRCGQVLVMTFAFSGFEFYCLDCGGRYGYFGPKGVPATPELEERVEALKQEWIALQDGLIYDGGHIRDCGMCDHQEHLLHATETDLAADTVARDRIAKRIKLRI